MLRITRPPPHPYYMVYTRIRGFADDVYTRRPTRVPDSFSETEKSLIKM